MTIRQKSENKIQTSIRNGRHDFLLRQKYKGDPTPWSQVPPVILDQQLPDFEIRNYKNIYQIEEEPEMDDKEEEQEEMDENEIQDLSNEIRRQYENDKDKRQDTILNLHQPSLGKEQMCLPALGK